MVSGCDNLKLNDDPEAPSRRRVRRRRSKRQLSQKTGTSDSISLYLNEIGEVPLLTGPEEAVLAREISEGMEAEARLAELYATEEVEGFESENLLRLQELQRDGEYARDQLTRANLRLVVSIAKKYSNYGLPLLDLVQEGNMGLMRAVEKFDGTKGYRFSTYATWWIQQAVSRAVSNQARTIKIPIHTIEAMNKVTRAQRELEKELGRKPSTAETSERTGLDPEKVEELIQLNSNQGTLSLDLPMGDDDGFNLAEVLSDSEDEGPESAAIKELLKGAISETLDGLDKREREIVEMRFGLEGQDPKTLDEIGSHFGVSRERIRQVETRILSKLRYRSDLKSLIEFMN
ncbi:MAG TPA: sigma-70 family RNA polymerase sigma factor [Acidimicrobiales bacterium]|nr:sigma-70 family RNA polymerase sigma factor [Acidimicrobiales bacterium]